MLIIINVMIMLLLLLLLLCCYCMVMHRESERERKKERKRERDGAENLRVYLTPYESFVWYIFDVLNLSLYPIYYFKYNLLLFCFL
jgi:Na+/melibiose symporter-like transporter